MAYKTMQEKSNGDPITATDWNEIVENFNHGIPVEMTTKGDMVAATGADTSGRKAVGANGTYLLANSADPSGLSYSVSAQKPLVHAYSGNGYSVLATLNAWTKQPFSMLDLYDPAGAIVNGKFTAPLTGYYFVIGQIYFRHTTGAGWWRAITGLYKNGVYECNLFYYASTGDAATSHRCIEGATILSLAAGDTLELYYYATNTGGNLYVYSDIDTTLVPRFMVFYL